MSTGLLAPFILGVVLISGCGKGKDKDKEEPSGTEKTTKELVDEYNKKLEQLLQNNLFKDNKLDFLKMQVFAASYVRTLAEKKDGVEITTTYGKTTLEKGVAMVMKDVKNRGYVSKNAAKKDSTKEFNTVGERIWQDGDGSHYAYSADRCVWQNEKLSKRAGGEALPDRVKNVKQPEGLYFAEDLNVLYDPRTKNEDGKDVTGSMGPNLVYRNMPYWMNNVFQGSSATPAGVSWPPTDDLMKEVTDHIEKVVAWRETDDGLKQYWDGMKAVAKAKEKKVDDFFKLAEKKNSGVQKWTVCQGYEMKQECWKKLLHEKWTDEKKAWECIEKASTSVPSIHFQTFLYIGDAKKFVGTDEDKDKREKVLNAALKDYLIPFLNNFVKTYENAFIHLKRAKDNYGEQASFRQEDKVDKVAMPAHLMLSP